MAISPIRTRLVSPLVRPTKDIVGFKTSWVGPPRATAVGQVRRLQLSAQPISQPLDSLPQACTFPPPTCSTAQESNFLKSLLPRTPIFLQQDITPEQSDKHLFKFPLGTFFNAPTREIALSMKQAFAHALKERGIVGIQLGFEDPHSHFLLEIVEAMGCTADSHSNRQGALVSYLCIHIPGAILMSLLVGHYIQTQRRLLGQDEMPRTKSFPLPWRVRMAHGRLF
jgi:hypothetical protein